MGKGRQVGRSWIVHPVLIRDVLWIGRMPVIKFIEYPETKFDNFQVHSHELVELQSGPSESNRYACFAAENHHIQQKNLINWAYDF